MLVITMGTYLVGPIFLPGHWFTVALHGSLIMIGGNYGHCGLESIHDTHHRFPLLGDYGFLCIADIILHTYHM